MDVDPAKLDPWRAYLLEYATGLLWLLACVTFWLSTDNLRAAAKSLNEVSRLAPDSHIPESFASFALALLLVVVPYTVAIAARPITASIMEVVSRIDFITNRRRYIESPRELRERAAEAIRRVLSVRGPLSREMHLIYLSVRNNELGRRMQLRIDDARFRSSASLPIALFIGAIAYHSTLRPPLVAAILAAVIAFALIGNRAARDLNRSFEQIDAAVILAADQGTSGNAEQTVPDLT